MIFFGHVGLTGLSIKIAEKFLEKTKIDYRVVVISSILPDVIDKPIGRILFAKTFNTGRVFGHTLLFVLILFGVGLYYWHRGRKTGWLVLAGCCLLHEVFDTMWEIPETFFWPFLGLGFYTKTEESWIVRGLTKLMTDPTLYVPEIVGLIITLYFLWGLIAHRKIITFLKNGTLK
ncbi:MAG: metal-dependent hydrolase [Desulfitobacteriaceae bacterium]